MANSGQIRFDGRAVIVTGAGRGMGREHALLLGSRGASVLVADNGSEPDGEGASRGPAQAVADEIIAAGGKAAPYIEDISTEQGATGAVEACLAAFGSVDAILHNASNAAGPDMSDELPNQVIERTLHVNTYAAFWLIRAAWPHMAKQKWGRIVLVSSHGIYGSPGYAVYAAAKSACIGLGRSIAVEGKPLGILVNILTPTAQTRLTEKHLINLSTASHFDRWMWGMMSPEKVSGLAAYLCSDECTVHGRMFSCGGGRIARITLVETQGNFSTDTSIESVRDRMPDILTEENFFPIEPGVAGAKMARVFEARKEEGVFDMMGYKEPAEAE